MKKHLFKKHWAGLALMLCLLVAVPAAWAQNVAKIGSTEYATLDAAIDAAVANDVIEIIASTCEITNTKVLPEGATLKGQGKNTTTMTIASTSGSGLTISKAGVTIKDMHIDGSQITSGGYKTLVNVRADNVLIDNVIMSGGGMSTWNSSILVETLSSSQTFTVSNSTISGSFRGVLRESCNANIVITNCDITATYPFNIDGGNGGTVTVTNGSLHGWTSYSGVEHVTFTNVTFSKVSYDCVAAYVNTTFNNCTMDDQFAIYAQTSGFTFELNDCTKGGVLVTNENFTTLFPSDPNVWNNCVTVVNDVILVGTQTQLDNAAASGTDNVLTRMTQSFAYDGNLCPGITSLTVNGDNGGDSTLTFSNCTFGSSTTPATLTLSGGEYTLSATCSNGCNVTLEHVAIVLGENASFTVNGQTDFFKPAQYYAVKETANGNGTYTYSTQYVGVAMIGETGYPTLNAAAAAVPVGTPTTIEILTNLNFYDISGSNLTDKTITFTGVATDTLTLTNAAHAQTAAYGADLTFENITLKNDMTSDVYRGIIHLNKFTINNCEVIGFMMGYAETFICNNCTFTKTGKYHMWTYGSNCTFNSCTFNSTGNSDCKAINVYKEGSLSQPFRVVTFNNCAFNSTPAVTTLDNSAIQINSALCCFVVNINNCTVNGYINNSSSIPGYENLVNNKSTSVATTLNIDGTQILKQGSCEAIAMIGATYYSSIQEAVDYANANLTGDVTIDLVANTSEIVKILQKDGISITLNGNDSTLTGQIFISSRQESPAYVGTYTAPNTVTIDNLNMKYDPSYFDGTSDEDGLIYFCKNCAFGNVLNYSHNVTISNCDFDADGSNQNVYGISSRAGSVFNLNIDNCTAKNAAGLATLQSAPQFEVTNCSTEDVKYGIRIVNNNGPMNITHNNFTADEAGFYVTGMTTGAIINMSEDTVNAPKAFMLDPSCTNGTLDITSGLYIGAMDDNATTDFFNMTGGTYSENVTGEACAPGYAAFANGTTPETWTVTKAWFLRYDPNGGTGHMDSSYVKQEASADHNVTLKDNEFQNGFNAFTTWNTKADGMGDNHGAGTTMEITCDTVVYAQWEPAKVMNVTKYMGYLTVKAAAAAADAGDTLELLMDLTEPNEVAVFANPVVLDLKGKTLTVSANEGLTFSNATDTVKVVNGHLTNASDALDIITANGGTVLLGEGLTAESNSSILWAYNEGQVIVDIDNNTMNTTSTQYALASAQGENAKIKVESGKLNAADINVFAATDKSVVEINGGELTSENYTAGYSTGEGEIVVNGGKISSKMSAVVARSIYSTTAGSVTVNGGEITSVNGAAVHVAENAGAAAVITGGTLTSTNSYGVKCANGGSVSISGNAIVKGATYGVDLAEGNVTITNDTTTVILRPIIVGGDSSINVASGATMLISGGIFSNNVADVDNNTLTPAYTGIYSTNYLAEGLGTMIIEDATNSIRTDKYMWQVEPFVDTVLITGKNRSNVYSTQTRVATGFTAKLQGDGSDVTANVRVKLDGDGNKLYSDTAKRHYYALVDGEYDGTIVLQYGKTYMGLEATMFEAKPIVGVGPYVFKIEADGYVKITKRPYDPQFVNGSNDTTFNYYNGHIFEVDYTQLQNTDDGHAAHGLANTDVLTAGRIYTNDSIAGTYPVTQGSFQADDDLHAIFENFKIENPSDNNRDVTTNYNPQFSALRLIIAPRPLTITVQGTKPYDGKTFGYMSSSFPKHGDDGINITGETPIYADGDTLTAYTLMKGTEVFADTCPGIYAVTVANVEITNAQNRNVTTSYDITIVDGNDTITSFNCGPGYDVEDTRDHVIYQTVLIGSQCWMTENLRADVGTNKIYGDESTNETKFGRLYTWYTAAGSATESDADVSNVETEPCMGDFIQGMCPDGWALPSSADFTELRSVVTNDLLRDPSNEYWVEGKQGVAAGNTGFQSRGAGHYTNRYESLLTETYYWTSDAKLYLGGGTPSIYSKCACDEYHCTTLTFMDFPKDQFKSVRCIRKKLNP